MSAVANVVDFVMTDVASIFGQSSVSAKPTKKGAQSAMTALLYMCYIVIFLLVCWTHDMAGLPGFSFVLFVGSAVQFLAFISLLLKVKATKTVSGISSRSMMLFAVGLTARVLSTTFEEGYLPSDKSGDWMIQCLDAGSLMIALLTLHSIHREHYHTYQEEHDSLPVAPILVGSAVCAYLVHGDLNLCVFFDSLWAFSLNIEVFQLLPQLHLFSKVGGVVDAATSHYVANMFLATCCRTFFWIWALPGCRELTSPIGYKAGWQMHMGGKHILVAHAIELLINLDFMYFYVKSWCQGGKIVQLPKAREEI